MPTNKREGFIYGICMCLIMVFFMGLLNISIHLSGLNLNSIKTAFIAFPVTFIIAFLLEELVVRKINNMLLEKFVDKSDSANAYILFNCFFIVTFMSLIMTVVGGFLSGDNIQIIFSEFFIRWPRNFCAAFFLNILVAGPISRFVLTVIQSKNKTFNETVDDSILINQNNYLKK